MINLKEYDITELSLIVFEEEQLYNMRHDSNFMELIRKTFDFTDAQLDVLENDLIDDLEESAGAE